MLLKAIGLSCFIAIFLLHTNKVHAQLPFGGFGNSHYAGIYGVPGNPASAAGTRYKWDINIAGVSAMAGNTYARFPKSLLFNRPDSLRQLHRNEDFFLDTSGRGKQRGWGAAEIMMPSVLYSIDEMQSVAFTWRIRASGNGGNMETDVANFFGQGFPNPRYQNKRYNMELGNGSGHLWNEFGFTYARVLKSDGDHLLKGGVTLKLLTGIAAGYAQVEDASFLMNNSNDGQINSGTLQMGYNDGINNWKRPNASNYKMFGKPGVGLDVGVIYEWRQGGDGLQGYSPDEGWNPEADAYKLRIGASVTDLGGIMYNKVANNTDLDLRTEAIDPNDLKLRRSEGIQAYYRRISQYFTPLEGSKDKFYMNTPTALNLMGDYNLDDRFFINAHAVIGLTSGKADPSKTYSISQLQVTPRYDTRYFGAYLPMMLNAYGQFNAGVGIRVGPLIIGSSSLLSNLFQKNINRTDGFVALRVVPLSFKKDRLGCPANNF